MKTKKYITSCFEFDSKQRPIDVAETSDMRALLYLQEPSGDDS